MNESGPCLYRFDQFCVDPAKLVLTRSGSAVPLPAKTFETLLVLIQHRDSVMDKDELIKLLWPDTFVQEINLTVHISRLRKALGENPVDHKYIVTVPRRGYRFVADIAEVHQTPEMPLVHSSERDHNAAPDRLNSIGRSKAHAVLPSETGTEGSAIRDEDSIERPVAIERTPGRDPHPAGDAMLFTGVTAILHHKLPRAVLFTAIGAVGLLACFIVGPRHMAQPDFHKGIAVLPFSFKGEPDNEYLAAGMIDGLASRLDMLPGLVVKRGGSAAKAGAAPDALTAGRQLDVAAVVEGALEQSEEGFHLSARLTRAVDGKLLWAGDFNVKPAAVISAQDLICERLADVMGWPDDPDRRLALTEHGTKNPMAYEAYLRGLYFWNKRSEEGLRKAIEYLTTAIAEDGHYARAYAKLADCYHLRAYYNFMTFAEAYPLQKAAATKAVELDETLAEGHMVLSEVLGTYEHNPDGARKELQRALELDPNNATVHQRYAWALAYRGRLDQGMVEMSTAVELDPLSVINNAALATFLYFNGDFEGARNRCQKALELDPACYQATLTLGMVHMQQGLFEDGVKELESAERNDDPECVDVLGTLGNAYAMAGKMTSARECIAKLVHMSRTSANALYGIALVYAGTQDKEAALSWLDRAARSDGGPEYLPRYDPRLAQLRSDPRFPEILRTIERPKPGIAFD